MSGTVVIAELSPNVARGIAEVFRASGLEVGAVCHDGLRALEAIKRLQPSVVTLDLVLPRLSGLHLARAIRRMGLPCTVVAITAVASRDRVEAARMQGVKYYVLKPPAGAKLRKVAGALAAAEARKDAAHL